MTRPQKHMRNIFAVFSLILGLSGSLVGCRSGQSDSTGGAGGEGGGSSELDRELASEVAETYAEIVSLNYQDALLGALALQTEIAAFLDDPTEDTLESAKTAWLEARESYLPTEAFRFYDGPIDNPETGPEGRLNAWPLDEAYIDYVEGDPAAGIVNDPEAEISPEALSALNEQGGEKNIATGYHAIEFLLWGQDLSEDGPGDRPVTDYTTADSAERRAEYLRVVTELLIDDLTFLVEAWAPEENNYRKSFLAAEPEEQLRRILTGLVVLSGFETGGERLQTAYDTQDQEDEHSCFSDNTHRDMVMDIVGIQNVYLGVYESNVSEFRGTGVYDLVRDIDPILADEVRSSIETSLSLATALEPPFDQELQTTAGRKRIAALIESLRSEQTPLLEEVFQRLGLDIPDPQ
jgi:putative iron-regulated protein